MKWARFSCGAHQPDPLALVAAGLCRLMPLWFPGLAFCREAPHSLDLLYTLKITNGDYGAFLDLRANAEAKCSDVDPPSPKSPSIAIILFVRK